MRNRICCPGLMLFAIAFLALPAPAPAQVESLPAPVVHGSSFEILSNSRYSSHSGFTSSLSNQVLSNILWAMSRTPSFGSSYRELYVATPTNVYLYDPAANALNVHLAGNHRYSSNSAFEVGIAVDRDEEAGLAVQAGLLSAVAFWSATAESVANCPMAYAANYANSNWNPLHTVKMVNVFGRATGTGLTDSCVATSSDSTLPRPATDGLDSFEVLLGSLQQDTLFEAAPVPISAVSQLLWAGYGVTPHMPIGKRGLTIPSAVAYYYLTTHIYLVSDTAVFRYHDRLPPGTSLSTSDHRLEGVMSGDQRAAFRSACPRAPGTAAAYVVVCVTDTTEPWMVQEAGFTGFQYLMQARALGMGGNVVAPITVGERAAIKTALGLAAAEQPAIIFSTGQVLTAVEEGAANAESWLEVVPTPGLPVRIEYRLPRAGTVSLVIRDMAGRAVRTWTGTEAQGTHVFEWPGTADNGRPVPAGAYVCRTESGGATSSARVLVTR
jgi:hypothetical protein